MKAHLTMFPSAGGATIQKVYDWEDTIEAVDTSSYQNNTRPVKVKSLSIYTHYPVIDGVRYKIAHMLSKKD